MFARDSRRRPWDTDLRRRFSKPRGLTLVEVMVALTIMSVVLIALGGLMFQVARQTRSSAATTYRTAALQRTAAWVEGLPWDSIDGSVGCKAESTGILTYNRCIQVVNPNPRLKEVTVIISPTGGILPLPDTLVVYRNRARSTSPLND